MRWLQLLELTPAVSFFNPIHSFSPENNAMPSWSSSSSALTAPNLRLRTLRIWSSKDYAIAAFIFLILFSLLLFSHLDSRSRYSNLIPLTLLRNANQTLARMFHSKHTHAPPSFFLFDWILILPYVQYAWTGAPLVTISEAGSDPDPAIGWSTLGFLAPLLLKMSLVSKMEKC